MQYKNDVLELETALARAAVLEWSPSLAVIMLQLTCHNDGAPTQTCRTEIRTNWKHGRE